MEPNNYQQPGMQPQQNPTIQPMPPQPAGVDVAPMQQLPQQQTQVPQTNPSVQFPAPGGVIQPNAPSQPQSSAMPQQQSSPTPVVGGPATQKKPKFLIVIIVGMLILGGMTVAAVVLAKPKKKVVTKNTTTQTTNVDQSNGPQPAKALDVEQSNNSINQDISGLNDEDDLPPSQLDDKALGL